MGLNLDEITILSVGFGDPQWMEITYVENDKINPRARVRHLHTLQVDPTFVDEDHEAVLSNLRDIVQAALIEERQPPSSFSAPR